MLYTPYEFGGWMKEAGFRDVEQIKTAPDHAAIVGQRP